MSGIIITGGWIWDNSSSSVEVLDPDLSPSSCSLPQLPEGISGHTQTGLTACGGGGSVDSGGFGSLATLRSCVTLSGGAWIKSHTLVQPRFGHCAWETDSGIILLGGSESPTTTELLKEDGGSELTFSLKYPSR